MQLKLALAFAVLFACFDIVCAEEAEVRLDRFFKDYLEELFRQQPLQATRLGDHRFDHLLDDLSLNARLGWTAFAGRTLKELPKQVDSTKLSRAGQIDFEIFKHDLETTLWLAENTHPFEEDPRVYGDYINDSIFLLLTQSTRPKETKRGELPRPHGADSARSGVGAGEPAESTSPDPGNGHPTKPRGD